jgi:ADP-heptose:LPS heptosyltransferase
MPDKILIIHAGGIGDLLLALPAMRIFRQAFPHSILEFLGRPERLALISSDLQASSIYSIDQGGMAYFYLEGVTLPPGLFTFFSSFRAVLIFGKAGGEILADHLRRIRVSRVIFIPSFPPEDLRVPVSDYLVKFLKDAGIGGERIFSPLRLPDKSLAAGRDFWAEHELKEGDRIIAIHPGSGSPAKNWAPKNFARVADWACERFKVLLVVGPAEDEVEEVKRAMKKANPIIADHLSLVQLAGVLKSCTAYVGNDSGITHLAATLGVPTLAIFGPTDPVVWSPKGSQVKVIYEKKSCSPCSSEMRSQCGLQCLKGIGPDAVIEILKPFLG